MVAHRRPKGSVGIIEDERSIAKIPDVDSS